MIELDKLVCKQVIGGGSAYIASFMAIGAVLNAIAGPTRSIRGEKMPQQVAILLGNIIMGAVWSGLCAVLLQKAVEK